MPLPRLLTTPSFRLTVQAVLLFSVSAFLVFALTYWAATHFMTQQMDRSLVAEMNSIEATSGGELPTLIEQHLASPSTREFFYLLEDSGQRRLAGNLPTMPARDGWQDLPPTRDRVPPEDDDDHMLRALGKKLADGSFLLVARDIDEIDEVSDFMENSFGIGFAVTLVVAFISGGMVSAGFLKRLDDITSTSREIMAGNLHRRITVGSGKDDFAGLSVSLNLMLDRIQDLMEGMQQVSNDIAHDLRTPLTRLRHGLERAHLTARSVDEFKAATAAALGEADGLLEIFTALLRITQIESGAHRAGFVSVDLSAIAKTIVETYAPVAEDEGHPLVARIMPDVLCPGDRPLLTQMLANLVENALRHTPPGATVTVELGAEGPLAAPLLVISDTGPGIPESERSKVFRRFHRLDASRSSAGYGLGLSTVAAIATLHRCTMILEDNAPGLRVTIRFEMNGKHGAASSEPASASRA